jgi:hypothetical protein
VALDLNDDDFGPLVDTRSDRRPRNVPERCRSVLLVGLAGKGERMVVVTSSSRCLRELRQHLPLVRVSRGVCGSGGGGW